MRKFDTVCEVNGSQSVRPITESLPAALAEEGISMRELARRTRRRFNWGSPWSIAGLCSGEFTPSRRGMEVIAATLKVDPRYFAEYRLLTARDLLNPEEVGLEKALRNLEASPRLIR